VFIIRTSRTSKKAEIDADANQKRLAGGEQTQRERQSGNEQCQARGAGKNSETVGAADATHEDEKRNGCLKRRIHCLEQRQCPAQKSEVQSAGEKPHERQVAEGLLRREFDSP
jgi:hypothetical protein